jgi:hypothetical protein
VSACFLLALLADGCARFARPAPGPPVPRSSAPIVRELEVTATAYNSHPSQTDGDPTETASGERLHVRALAVSDDLFEGGLGFGARVEIDGLPGTAIRAAIA